MGRTACTEPQCLYKGDLYLFLTPVRGDLYGSQFLVTLYNPLAGVKGGFLVGHPVLNHSPLSYV